MQQLLIYDGVPPGCITPEDQSTTTLENIRNAKRLLQGHQVVIVTDSYHARRARMVATHFGLTATINSPKPTRRHIKQHIREALALPAYALKLRGLNRT